jgi:hypothetical protein
LANPSTLQVDQSFPDSEKKIKIQLFVTHPDWKLFTSLKVLNPQPLQSRHVEESSCKTQSRTTHVDLKC